MRRITNAINLMHFVGVYRIDTPLQFDFRVEHGTEILVFADVTRPCKSLLGEMGGLGCMLRSIVDGISSYAA